MSTTLKPLRGSIEIPDVKTKSSTYNKTDFNMSLFYGGIHRGKSLQIGFYNEKEEYCHIQLDNDNAKELLKLLQDNL